MVEVVGWIVSERWARSLAVLALASGALSAQAGVCVPRAPWVLPSTHYAQPGFVQWRNDSLLILGTPAFETGRDPAGRAVRVDSAFAGVLVLPDGSVRKIPLPPGATSLQHPRGIVRPDGIIEVVWADALPKAPGDDHDRYRVQSARLAGGTWQHRAVIAERPSVAGFDRSSASELVRSPDGAWQLVFADEGDAADGWRHRLGIVRDSLGRWRVDSFVQKVLSYAALDVAMDGDVMTVLFSGLPLQVPDGMTVFHQAIYLTRLLNGVWTEPVPLAGTGEIRVTSPRLVQTAAGLIAAWVERGETSRLQWGRVEQGVLVGSVQTLDGIHLIWASQRPYGSLITAATTDGRGQVLRLRPDGYEVIADLPTRMDMPPTVVDIRGRPWAFTVEDVEEPDPGSVRLVGYDLGCAVNPGGSPVRR